MTPLILPDRRPAPHPVAQPAGPVGIVLVGCGAVARLFYQPALHELGRRHEADVLALVDPLAGARDALAAHFPQAKAVATFEAVGAPPGSLAIIASPPKHHASHALAALRRGWHVLCEKPMASTPEECAAMVEQAAVHERVLAVGHYKRFFPVHGWLREAIRRGTFGELRSFDIQEGGPFRWPAATPSFFSPADTPGGVLLDIGVHVLDLLDWWLGEPAETDYADDASGGLEANAVLTLAYASGLRGRVQLSRDWPTRQAYRFEFERGTVEWQVNAANSLSLHLHGLPAALQGTLLAPDGEAGWTAPQCFIAQLQAVVAAVQGRGPVPVTGAEGMRIMALISRLYRDRRPLGQPWLRAPAPVTRFLVSPP